MSRDASVDIDWADGTYHFRLGWGEIIKLQEAVDAGPWFLLQQMYQGTWRIEHISHVIRLGLIGGGKDPVEALKVVRSYVESRPPLESLQTAIAVLAAGCAGAPEEPPAKKAEAAKRSTTSRKGKSASPQSTAQGPR